MGIRTKENSFRADVRGNNLSRINLRKIDILMAVATISIGLEFLPYYFGVDLRELSILGVNLRGLTVAWILFPPILLISFIRQMKSYLSVDVALWLIVFLFPILSYASFVNWNENIPFGKVPEVVRSFSTALFVFMFYTIRGRTTEGRTTFALTLVGVGTVATLLNIADYLGFSERSNIIVHLGNNLYIERISPMGDPNITTIYILALGVSLPFWQRSIGRLAGFVAGTLSFALAIVAVACSASRGGILAVIMSGLVLYFSMYAKLGRYKLVILFTLGFLFFFLFASIKELTLPRQFDTLNVRLNLIALEGLEEKNLNARIVSALWLIKDIFTSPQLIGIGYEEFARHVEPTGGSWLPHNSFVDLYVIGGIVAFLAYITLWWRTAISQIRSISYHDEMTRSYGFWGIGFGAGLGVLLLTVSTPWTKIIWAYLGIGIAIYRFTRHKSKYRIRWS